MTRNTKHFTPAFFATFTTVALLLGQVLVFHIPISKQQVYFSTLFVFLLFMFSAIRYGWLK